jgi:predicted amidophosphoribosyltransferase
MSEQTVRSTVVDRIVVLVDDVMTTGATLDSCARVLTDAGAREVRALTVARRAIHNEGHT